MKYVGLVIVVGVVIVVGAVMMMRGGDGVTRKTSPFSGNVVPGSDVESSSGGDIPNDLSLPFNISDIISEFSGINPIGVVRFGLDEGSVGHGGIDVLLTWGASVYAVASGPVVIIESSSDPWGGESIKQIVSKTGEGEARLPDGQGWAFLYEHVTPVAGLRVGSSVEEGEMIATKTAPNAFTAHFQLSYALNNYEYNKEIQCWPDYLSVGASRELLSWWNRHRVSEQFIEGWMNVSDEGKYQFRGLLDKSKYPDGPQMCYPLGTDVRIPI